MLSISKNDPQRNITPDWRTNLHTRAISDQVIAYCRIRANGRGWLYPVAPGVDAQRWKAYPDQRGPKYKWVPGKPNSVTFYDPRGDLAQHIAAADGVLILAAGDADVWALMTGGIFNTTCTMLSETSTPDWLIAELHRLGVHTVRYYPDRDQAGSKAAQKLRDKLAGSGITLGVYTLPFPDDSKGDINALLIDVGAGGLADALGDCAPYELPPLEDHAPSAPSRRRDPDIIPDDYKTLYDRWCADVERAAISAWGIDQRQKHTAKGIWSKNLFASPLRPAESVPSARWNYDTHGFKDFADDEFYNTHQVAELLGLPSWEDHKHLHALTIPDPEPNPAYLNGRRALWHWSHELRHKLLTLPSRERWFKVEVNGQRRSIAPDLINVVMVLELLIRAEHDELITPGATVSRDVIALLSEHYGFNFSENTIRQATEWGVKLSILRIGSKFFFGGMNLDSILKIETEGNRQPTAYILNDQDEAVEGLWSTLRDHALKVTAMGTEHADDYHAHWGIDDRIVEAGNARRAGLGLYDSEKRRAALDTIEKRFKFLRGKYGARSQRQKPLATLPAPGTDLRNPAAYRKWLVEGALPDDKITAEPDYKIAAAAGVNSRGALHRAYEKLDIVREQSWKETTPDNVPDEVKARGWGYHERDGKAYVQQASLKRPATEVENAEREQERAAKRLETAQQRQQRREMLAAMSPGARAIVLELERAEREQRKREREFWQVAEPDRDPLWYIVAQCKLSFPDHIGERGDGQLQDNETGEVVPGTIENYARAGAGLELVHALPLVEQGGDTMPTHTAYSAPVERDYHQDSEPADISPITVQRIPEPPPPLPDQHDHGECVICGQPATETIIGAGYCTKHAQMEPSALYAELRALKADAA